MALIETRWITTFQEQAINLAGETWMRRLPFGRNWTRMRIGFIATLQGGFIEGTNNPAALQFFNVLFGLVSGDAWQNGILQAMSGVGATLNGSAAVNAGSNLNTASTWPTVLWGGSVSPHYFTFAYEHGDGAGHQRQSTTFNASTCLFYPDQVTDGLKRRGIYVLDIYRNNASVTGPAGQQGGSGSLQMDIYIPNNTGTAFNLVPTPADLMDAVSTENQTITVDNFTLQRTSIAVNHAAELGFGWDTVFIHVATEGYPMLIYAIACCVFHDTPYSTQSGASQWMTEYPVSGTTSPVTASQLNGGYGWTDPNWNIVGTGNSASSLVGNYGFGGTASNFPLDIFQLYNTTPNLPTLNPVTGFPTINSGTGWTAAATINGTGCPDAQSGYSGTSSGWPADTFDTYQTGTVITGVTINAGTGWDSYPALIY